MNDVTKIKCQTRKTRKQQKNNEKGLWKQKQETPKMRKE